MSGLPWFKCYPRDFNEGLIGLTLEERGAYATILNIIYAKGGPIDDDANYFRMLFGCLPKTWARVRTGLIKKRRLFEVNVNGAPCLMDERAATEIAQSEQKSKSLSEAGQRGAQKSNARHIKNNDIESAYVQPGISDTDTEEDTERGDANASLVVSASPKPTTTDEIKIAFDEWNALAERLGLPIARKLDPGRRTSIRARLAEGGLPIWREALAAVEGSRHCRGENDRGWKADLDFVCQPKSWRRLLEGTYGAADATGPPKLVVDNDWNARQAERIARYAAQNLD